MTNYTDDDELNLAESHHQVAPEQTGLRLDVTGLGCYHRRDVPAWYDGLNEERRWAAQARW